MSVWLSNGKPGQECAIAAEVLFLINLLALPVIGFGILAILYFRQHKTAPPLAAAHLSQTFSTSVWGGVLIVCAVGLIGSLLILGGISTAYVWVIVIVYFTMIHSTLVVIGALGLAKAMAGQCWRYPLIGPSLPAECNEHS